VGGLFDRLVIFVGKYPSSVVLVQLQQIGYWKGRGAQCDKCDTAVLLVNSM